MAHSKISQPVPFTLVFDEALIMIFFFRIWLQFPTEKPFFYCYNGKKNLWKILFKDYTSSPITTSSQFVCSIITKFYQHIQALVFAVKEINENPKLLPNITLGFHIYDSFYDARMAYGSTLDLLFKSYAFLPNYKCGIQNNFIGFIGGLTSDISSCMADILTVFKVPQVRPKELKS